MLIENNPKRTTVLVTGSAGFIGFHVARMLLGGGQFVVGLDNMNTYYEPALKHRRVQILKEHADYAHLVGSLEDADVLERTLEEHRPDVVIHLAAQAGVRYSIENPDSYFSSNILGSYKLLEAIRRYPVEHLLIASSSSVYGANDTLPYSENEKADHPVSFYAASKKALESIAHSYAHLYSIPTTIFRFFTVYGPWGRPDMALYKFTRAILNGDAIDVYGNGNMKRDFTYVDDLVRAIQALIQAVPQVPGKPGRLVEGDSISPVAPWRIVNIGNSASVPLLQFIEAIENATGRRAIKNMLEMQSGEVIDTLADSGLLKRLTGYQPSTPIDEGVSKFIEWYRLYEREQASEAQA